MSSRKLVAMEGHAPAPKLAEEERAVETELALVMAALLCAFMAAMALHSLLRCVFRRFRSRTGNGNGNGNDSLTFVSVAVLQSPSNGNGNGNRQRQSQNDDEGKGRGEGAFDAVAMAALPMCKQQEQGKEKEKEKEEEEEEDEEEGEGASCAICLTRLRQGDVVRVMGVCCHRFHVACIDTWLSWNSSCPVCRRSLLDACPGEGTALHTGAAPAEATATDV